MQIKLHTDSVQATFHDAAYEPCRSEIRAMLEEYRHEAPEVPFYVNDDQACEKLVAKIQDQLVACVAMHSEDSGICEIKNLYTKEYEEHMGVTKIMLQLLIKKARKFGCHKLRSSLPSDWNQTVGVLRELGFTPYYSSLSSPKTALLTMELSLDA
jgi:N-acetylglutamate synthase-like GNAT family acetyltransferase